jgi:EmrB/QacA subfamily drug resistance transporter
VTRVDVPKGSVTVLARRRARSALAVIAAAQLIVVLDASVVTIALPAAQADLDMADSSRQWMFTGYSLAFGGLLLLGGRVADMVGRKAAFLAGLVGFTCASVLGGIATEAWLLLAARGAQGAFAALLAPAGLAMLTTIFPGGRDRARAFAIFGAATGSGGVVGMVLGGVLTSYGSWRWCLLINLPLGLAVLVIAMRCLAESTSARPARFDLWGTATATVGLGSLMFGVGNVAVDGWATPTTIGATAVGVMALGAFILIEWRSAEPMMPLRIVCDRVRGSAFAVILLVNAATYAFYLLLTFYLQNLLGYSALAAGVAFVPIGIGVLAGSTVGGKALSRYRPAQVAMCGLVVATVGMSAMGLLGMGMPFWAVVLPAQLLIGMGVAATLTTIVSLALVAVRPSETGVTSALTNAVGQVGGAVGVAVLNVVVILVTAAQSPPDTDAAAQTGYLAGFAGSAALLAVALGVAIAGTRRRDRQATYDAGAP